MFRPVLGSLVRAVPVILVVAVLTFFLMHLLPGDPAVVIAGPDAPVEAVERIRAQLGLDRSIAEQLFIWLGQLAHGNFGTSLVLNQSVVSAVIERLPVTLSLSVIAMAIVVPVGVACGVTAAYFRGSLVDQGMMLLALLGVSVPSFWLAILSVILFSVVLGWLPSSGYVPLSEGFWPWLAALIQPAVILALFQIGFLARTTRSAMLEVLGQDFVRTARSKGLTEWLAVMKHAFRNALIPVVTAMGIILSLLIGGSVIIEQVFALPGIGRLVVQGILVRDYPLVQGCLLLFGCTFVIINVLIDLLYTVVDPRVRNA